MTEPEPSITTLQSQQPILITEIMIFRRRKLTLEQEPVANSWELGQQPASSNKLYKAPRAVSEVASGFSNLEKPKGSQKPKGGVTPSSSLG